MGWGWNEFLGLTGYDLRKEWGAEIGNLQERGWGEADETGFRLNAQGIRFADAAGELFLRPE